MSTSPLPEPLATLVALAADLRASEHLLAEKMARTAEKQIPFLRQRRSGLSREDVRRICLDNVRVGFQTLNIVGPSGRGASGVRPTQHGPRKVLGDSFDPTVASATGIELAAAGAPFEVIFSLCRSMAQLAWEAIVEAAARHSVTAQTLVLLASDVFEVHELGVEAMAKSYRAETMAIVVHQQAERSALVGALLEGRAAPSLTVWEIADLLRIPHTGGFAVVVAELTRTARGVLGDIESRLRSAGTVSAWLMLPDFEVGIVSVPGGQHDVRALGEVLRATSRARQGISPVYFDLADTAKAMRLARVALLGSLPAPGNVVVFDDAPLPVTSVADPEINERVARSVLAGLDALPSEQRELLVDTLQTWLDCDGSMADTAKKLFLHRNTVRQRLSRLEALTGRTLSSPRDVAQLCLAVETMRRLPWPNPG